MTKRERMWVFPDFKKKIKIEAAKEGVSTVEFTKRQVEADDPFKSLRRKTSHDLK